MEKPYKDLVAQAERAVSEIKSAEIRRVAFEKVLGDLLSGAIPVPAPSPPRLARATRRARVRRTPARPTAQPVGPQACVAELIARGFFGKPKSISQVKAEIEKSGRRMPLTSLSGPLKKLCLKKSLRRQKADGKGNKTSFVYSKY
jgi:hypothetical protein